MKAIYLLIALTAGLALAVQVALNGRLRTAVGSPISATLISMCVGAVAALACCLAGCAPFPDRDGLAAAPWWAWCGGLLGLVYLWAGVVAAPRLGMAVTLALVVSGQMVTAMVMDHFGLLGVAVSPVTGWRLLGVGLVVAGAAVLATTS